MVEWRRADRTFETWDTLALPEGGTTRVRRLRKATADVVKRLRDRDGDGVFEAAEVVLDGAEMPTSILPIKGGLLLTSVGRLERWTDEYRSVTPEAVAASLGGLVSDVDKAALTGEFARAFLDSYREGARTIRRSWDTWRRCCLT